MPQQLAVAVENNFTKGLLTESTGLNFPENAATDCDNVEFTLVGDVIRREGINKEPNFGAVAFDVTNRGQNDYVWNNAGGDGNTKILVRQIGDMLLFYSINSATTSSPISQHVFAQTMAPSTFLATNATFDPTLECQFTDGNGILFVYHPNCNPFYVTFALPSSFTANPITVQIRDFTGLPEAVPFNYRPNLNQITPQHDYNLTNQGWVNGNPYSFITATQNNLVTGVQTFAVPAGATGVNPGDVVTIYSLDGLYFSGSPLGIFAGQPVSSGTVVTYTGSVITINITYVVQAGFGAGNTGITYGVQSAIYPTATGNINVWVNDIGNLPSNADVWWLFKDNTGVFNPTTTIANVTISNSPAPKGHFILDAFNQDRQAVSGWNVGGTRTTKRPTTGCWFAGRTWYTGVNDSQAAVQDTPFYTWTENIYFSQVITDNSQFGYCYQLNDPTSETFNGLLPTDGGVITISGCGSIYRLFPVSNGLLVFAANGVWFITGSQGIGFTANDYTVTKISSVQSISSTSFVDVLGLPFFWNEEGIYQVQAQQNGSLSVEPITVGTILTLYADIPFASKKYARGVYDPINYVIQWIYREVNEADVTSRYRFTNIMNFNTYNKAFFPYSVSQGNLNEFINGITYITYPTLTVNTPDPTFYYLISYFVPSSGQFLITHAYEYDTSYLDWGAGNYDSYFITGYKIRGQGIKRFQPQYVQIYSRTDGGSNGYKLQGIWDYADDPNSGRYTTIQNVTLDKPGYAMAYKRHKIRGHGYTLQFKVMSQDGTPFDIIGWAVVDTVNSGT